ncbi:isochorismate lyase [Alcanivorax sp.]|uniref:isochorismate lyase n=1 Tax=Alcanivorax sp. TaxID=1872427 RepID=UPI0039E71003
MTGKSPEECLGMEDIRAEIDCRERQIIALLGERAGYVHAAAAFKTSEDGVRAPARFKAMLETRRDWAEQEGLDADMVEKLYRDLVEHFIQREMAAFESS